jgi:hypothetical protein
MDRLEKFWYLIDMLFTKYPNISNKDSATRFILTEKIDNFWHLEDKSWQNVASNMSEGKLLNALRDMKDFEEHFKQLCILRRIQFKNKLE